MNNPERNSVSTNKYQTLRECFSINTSQECNEKAKKYNSLITCLDCFESVTQDTSKENTPPIHVYTPITNYFQFGMILQDIFSKNFVLEYLDAQIKIEFFYIKDYMKFKNFCDNNCIEYHTYTLDSEKMFSWVVKGLDGQWKLDEIIKELQQKGLKPVSCSRLSVLYPVHKVNYKINFDQDVDPSSVMKVTKLFNCNIHWEKYESKQVEQCQRCQAYGHLAENCTRNPICMKCAKKHGTEECTKPKNLPATCCNCNGNHPANDSHCPSYLAYLEKQRKDPNLENKETVTDTKVDNNVSLEKPMKTDDSNVCINNKETQTTFKEESSTKVKDSINVLCDVVELLEEVNKLDSLCDVKEMIQTVRCLTKKLSDCKNNTEKVIAVLEALKLIDN